MSELPVALLLEDEPLIAMDVEQALENAGFKPVTFGNCHAAEEWLAVNRPNVAILDITLPDGPCTGIGEVLTARKVPFIVHSGELRGSSHVHDVFRTAPWMGKPAYSPDLVSAARKLLVQQA